MTPDLGKYAFEVLASYGVSLGLILAITGLSWWQSHKTKAALAAIELSRKGERNE